MGGEGGARSVGDSGGREMHRSAGREWLPPRVAYLRGADAEVERGSKSLPFHRRLSGDFSSSNLPDAVVFLL
jgi:hypothetical protein